MSAFATPCAATTPYAAIHVMSEPYKLMGKTAPWPFVLKELSSLKEAGTYLSNPGKFGQGTVIVLVRHGQCPNNAHDVVGSTLGPQDDANGLTQQGREEAAAEGRKLLEELEAAAKERNVSMDEMLQDVVMVTSPNKRAHETGDIQAKIVKYTRPIFVEFRLKEGDFGDYEGKSAKEYMACFKDRIHRFTNERPPNGESGDEIQERNADWDKEIAHTPALEEKIVVGYTHWYDIAQHFLIAGRKVEELEKLKDKAKGGQYVCFWLTKKVTV